MDQQYQPLFNRTYLKILPWIVAIIIVLLTARSQNSTSDLYEALPDETQENSWIYLSIDKESRQDQLKLVYPLSPAFSEQQTQQRIALQTSFRQALQTQRNITAQWHDDKITLTIRIPTANITEHSFNLKALLNAVTNSAIQFYPQALQHATAERYLALNTIDELALSHLKSQLATPSTLNTPDHTDNLLYNRPMALLVLKKENDSLSRTISEQLKALYPFSAEPLASATRLITPDQITLQHRGTSYLYLIGQPISSDNNKVSRSLAFHYINQTLKNIANNNLSHYHLILRPSTPVGYAALSMTQNSPFQHNVVSNIKTYLLEQLNDEKIDQIRSSLSTQYEEQFESPEKRADLIVTTLFSEEKLQSADEFHDTLASISTQQVQAHIQQLFDSEHAIIVKISPP